MTEQKYVKAAINPIRWQEALRAVIFGALLIGASIGVGKLVSLIPSWNRMELLALLFIVPIVTYGYIAYFLHYSYRSVVLDHVYQKKVFIFLISFLGVMMFYRPDETPVRLAYVLMGSDIILCYFFGQYLVGIGRKDTPLEKWAVIRAIWFGYPLGFTITGITLHYLARKIYDSYYGLSLL